MSLIGARSAAALATVQETLTLLFTKLHLEPYQSQTEVCLQRAAEQRLFSHKKTREENKVYWSCQNFILSEFLLYKCLAICKHKHTPTQRHTPRYAAREKSTHSSTHCISFQSRMLENLSDSHKEKQIYLFI